MKSIASLLLVAFALHVVCAWKSTDVSHAVPDPSLPLAMLNSTTLLVVDDSKHTYQCTKGPASEWIVQDLTEDAGFPLTVTPLSPAQSGPYPKLSFFGIEENTNDVYLAQFFLFSQPVWTVFDITTDNGLPRSKVPPTPVNSLEFVVVEDQEDHVVSVSYNPTSSFFTSSDLTADAGIPATNVAVRTLNGVYPDIQLISVNMSNGHVYGSYFNQPTPTGWEVYDFTERENVAETKIPPTIISGGQFIVVGTDNHVHNYYFENGWQHQDLTTKYGVPETQTTVTKISDDPFMIGTTAINGDVTVVTYDGKYILQNLSSFGIPKAVGPVAVGNTKRLYIIGASDGHVYELNDT